MTLAVVTLFTISDPKRVLWSTTTVPPPEKRLMIGTFLLLGKGGGEEWRKCKEEAHGNSLLGQLNIH